MSQIQRIEIKNIKAIEDFEITFDKEKKLILLLGHNNSGKTSILEAVRLFFSDDRNAEKFWPLDTNGNFRELDETPFVLVEIEFSQDEISSLKSELTKSKHDVKLEKHLIANKLIIRKPLKKDSNNKIAARILECKFNDKDSFENFTGIEQALSRLLPRHIYLESIANLEDYQSASQRAQHSFEELFDLYFEGLQWEKDEDIKSLVTNLINKINEKIGISDIKEKLQETLHELDNELEAHELTHGFTGVSDLSNLIKKVKITLKDNVVCDATLKGSGTQRLVIFSLLKLIAQQRRDKKFRDTIFLIDEPDLHLHPQLQKQIRVVIEKLSESYPVIVCTHSHLMIGKAPPKDYCVRKMYKKDGMVKNEVVDNEEKFFRELFIYLGYVPSDFMLPDNIILVEGKHDKRFIDEVVDLMKENNEIEDKYKQYDVSVIDIGGDGQITKAFHFLNDLSSALSFFQGLPAYANRFCGFFDNSKSKSLPDLKEKANDKITPYRIIALDKNGIEYFYPKTLLNKYGRSCDNIVKSDEEKSKVANYIQENIQKEHLKEIDNRIKDLIKLAFKNCEIL